MFKPDKQAHFLVGFICVIFLAYFSIKFALGVCVFIAIAKEIYDAFHVNHTADVWDAIATIVGGLIAALFYVGVIECLN